MAIKSAIKKVVIKFKLACRLSDKLVVFTQSLCLAMAGAYFLCLETGRDFIGIELAPEYFKTAQDRLTE